MVRLMVETVALHLAMCLNRDLCEQVDRAEQPQQRSDVTIVHMKVAAPTSPASSHHLQGEVGVRHG